MRKCECACLDEVGCKVQIRVGEAGVLGGPVGVAGSLGGS